MRHIPIDTPLSIDGGVLTYPNPYESIDSPDENAKRIAEIRKAMNEQPYEEKHERRRRAFNDGPMRFD